VIMIEELKAKYQAVFLTIRILDQIKSKLWSNHGQTMVKLWSNYRSMELGAHPYIP